MSSDDLTVVSGISDVIAERLHNEGYPTLEDVANANVVKLSTIEGIDEQIAVKYVRSAQQELILSSSEKESATITGTPEISIDTLYSNLLRWLLRVLVVCGVLLWLGLLAMIGGVSISSKILSPPWDPVLLSVESYLLFALALLASAILVGICLFYKTPEEIESAVPSVGVGTIETAIGFGLNVFLVTVFLSLVLGSFNEGTLEIIFEAIYLVYFTLIIVVLVVSLSMRNVKETISGLLMFTPIIVSENISNVVTPGTVLQYQSVVEHAVFALSYIMIGLSAYFVPWAIVRQYTEDYEKFVEAQQKFALQKMEYSEIHKKAPDDFAFHFNIDNFDPSQYTCDDEVFDAIREVDSILNDYVRLASLYEWKCELESIAEDWELRSTYLRGIENNDLRPAEQVLSNSADVSEVIEVQLENQRRDVIESLSDQIHLWRDEIDTLEQRAKPYLGFNEYLYSDEILKATASVHNEVTAFRKTVTIVEFIDKSLLIQFHELEQETSILLENLQHSRIKYAKKYLRELEADNEEALGELKRRLEPAQESGAPISSPAMVTAQIEDIRKSIDEFQNTPYSSHLDEDEFNELYRQESKLDKLEEFVQEKTHFDSEISNHSHSVERLQSNAKPYLEYSQYLTRPNRLDLNNHIETCSQELEEFAKEIDFDILSNFDNGQMDNLQEKILYIESHLLNYNSEFVLRKRKKCKDLFSNIGSNGLELTAQQERAVIRNGIYNQVVAAAGTGKTLTLTTRVAYLIKELGVDSEEILVVTFTNEATDEMKERLQNHFDITNVEIRTIHSFGRNLLQETEDEFVQGISSSQKINFIEQQIREARQTEYGEFLDHYYEFLVHFDDVYYEEADFETQKEYVQARANQTYTTLKGEDVKSRAEKIIADFLFTHQVDYRYEDLATWAETAPEKGEYDPDFYLPNYGIYIEHWGIDESGSVAPWFTWTSTEYHDKIKWARTEFDKTEYSLIETYEFEHETGRLKQALRHRLSEFGVELKRMEFENLVETAFDYDQREKRIKKQFSTFIDNARLFDVKHDDIKTNLSSQNPRQYHFGHCGIYLLQKYVIYLTENGLVDYTDMIHEAVALIRETPELYKERYEHILVDEFQDVGTGIMGLIQELTGPDAAKLFAVGDDWQSIYSFQGADVNHFINFEGYFGKPVRTDLTANFRSPPQVVSTGNYLIQNNSKQLDKQVRSKIDRDTTPRVHSLQGYNISDYIRRVRRYTVSLVQQYLKEAQNPSEIMILCRFDDAALYLGEIKNGLRAQKIPYVGKSDEYHGPDGGADGRVAVYTPHRAKVQEAKHVILVHAAEGRYGFPPEGRENELIQPVQPLNLGGVEEERRAFYVAITRTKYTLDILTRAGKESRFLNEISKYTHSVDAGKVEPLDEVGECMTIEVKVEKLREPWAKQHQRGTFGDLYGGSALFVSWESSNPPTLEEGEWYKLTDVRVGEYKNDKELVLTEMCSVTHLPDGSSGTNIDEI